MDDQRHEYPLISHCLLFAMALKGMEPVAEAQALKNRTIAYIQCGLKNKLLPNYQYAYTYNSY